MQRRHLSQLSALLFTASSLWAPLGVAAPTSIASDTASSAAAALSSAPRVGSTSVQRAGVLGVSQAPGDMKAPQPNTGQTLPDRVRAEEIRGQKRVGIALLTFGTVIAAAIVLGLVMILTRRTWSST